MKLNFAFFGALFTLLLGALLFANHRRQQTLAYLLSGYPPSENLGFIIKDHAQPPADNIVFMTDWFPYGSTQPNSGCNVTRAGRNCTLRAGVPSGPSVSASISQAQFAAFDAIAPTLPPGAATAPALANLLVVSFRRNGSWTTRIYDRSHLPTSVVRAHQALGIKGFGK